MNAVGILEVSGFVTSIRAIDEMLKVSDVQVMTWEKKLGGRLVSIVITGDTCAVHEAIENGERVAQSMNKTVIKAIVNNPHEEVMKIVHMSAVKHALV